MADGATVDALQLRAAAESIASSKPPREEAALNELVNVAAKVGDGAFLPEWESLETKVTGGRSGTAAVVEDARAQVDRWRTSLLIAIADEYSARNRQSSAIPYLERVVESYPDNETATKKLVAAYLETGQSERARSLQEGRNVPTR